ncbi:MAG: hypothetical protein IJ507_06165 [Clostridia bacterium]|nr:hypothetical protein [Clostridia bacterium]
MLIRNASLRLDGQLRRGMELRLMHGAVQETGVGLLKGLYESELDLQGDEIRPGSCVIQSNVTAEQLRKLYRQGVSLVITDVKLTGRRQSPRVIMMSPLPRCVPEELAETVIQPGTHAPLTRWKPDGTYAGMIDEHAAD